MSTEIEKWAQDCAEKVEAVLREMNAARGRPDYANVVWGAPWWLADAYENDETETEADESSEPDFDAVQHGLLCIDGIDYSIEIESETYSQPFLVIGRSIKAKEVVLHARNLEDMQKSLKNATLMIFEDEGKLFFRGACIRFHSSSICKDVFEDARYDLSFGIDAASSYATREPSDL